MKEMKSAQYEHGTDRPMKAKQGGRPVGLYGCDDFKSDSMDQAYGQAGMEGCKKDMGKIHSQHFHSYSDDHSCKKG
jgi:hypothetical protein